MNIDELTIGQAKEITKMFGISQSNKTFLGNDLIGKYVIVRSRNEGINAGVVKEKDETGIALTDARRLWWHKPANNSAWYEGVSINGLSEESQISAAVELKVIIEEYSVVVCTKTAEESIRTHKAHEQN